MGVFSTLLSWAARKLMRVHKREFVGEFAKLSCVGQFELHEADESREFVREFQFSCLGQTKTRVAGELRNEDLCPS